MSVWLTDLADILRSAGLNVIEETYIRGRYQGKTWKQVGFGGRGLRSFDYILWHHDASPPGDDGSPGALQYMMYWAKDGNVDLTPAAAAWVCVGCRGQHVSGTWHIYAAGESVHAGRGGPWTPNNGNPHVPANGMNARSWAIEVDHTYGEQWKSPVKQAQLNSLRMGTAAVLAAYNLPSTRVIRHLDWTNGQIDGVPRLSTFGRKNDLDGIDLPYERRLLDHVIKQLQRPDVKDKQLARLERMRRTWRRKRDEIRESGKTAGLATARKKIRELNQRIRKIGG
jgi:hypothetical protein